MLYPGLKSTLHYPIKALCVLIVFFDQNLYYLKKIHPVGLLNPEHLFKFGLFSPQFSQIFLLFMLILSIWT